MPDVWGFHPGIEFPVTPPSLYTRQLASEDRQSARTSCRERQDVSVITFIYIGGKVGTTRRSTLTAEGWYLLLGPTVP